MKHEVQCILSLIDQYHLRIEFDTDGDTFLSFTDPYHSQVFLQVLVPLEALVNVHLCEE